MNPQTQCERKKCLWTALAASVILALLPGCATTGTVVQERDAAEADNIFGFRPRDIVMVAGKMSASLAQHPLFHDASLQPSIRVDFPDVSKVRRGLLTVDEAPAFTRRLTTELMKNPARRAKFISREDAGEAVDENKKVGSGAVTSGGQDDGGPKYLAADFFLRSSFMDVTKHTTDGKVVTYLLCSFRLVDRRTTEIAWQDDYEVKLVTKSPTAGR